MSQELELALIPQSYVSIWDDSFLAHPLAAKIDSCIQSPKPDGLRAGLRTKNLEEFIRGLGSEIRFAYDTEQIPLLKRQRRMQQEGLRLFVTEPLVQELAVAWETWGGYPQTFFIFKLGEKNYVGKKRLSPLNIAGRIHPLFDAAIRELDILGELQSFRCTQDRVWIHFRGLTAVERGSVWASLKIETNSSIEFPFCALDQDGKEMRTAIEGWEHSENFEKELEAGEEQLMAASLAAMKKFKIESGTVYDPACSTGIYLSYLKSKISGIKTVGQDLSKDMIDAARSRLDQVFVGDAKSPAVPKNSVDLLILRFLNSEVLTTAYAQQIAEPIVDVLKPNGFAFAFGFTPLLLSADFLKSLGFEILQTHFFSEENQSIYPFYILKKNTAITTRALYRNV